MSSLWSEFWTHTVTRHPLTAQDTFAGDTESASEALTGRVELQQRVVMDPETGNQVIAAGTFFTGDECKPRDRLVYDGRRYEVIDVFRGDDLETGLVDHYEVVFR